MDDDDDYVDIDIDQIVQAHTSRGSEQAGTQLSEVNRIDQAPVPSTAQPPQRPSGTGGLLPPYQPTPYYTAPYNSYGGQSSRLPQQPQQGGSIFQNTAVRGLSGAAWPPYYNTTVANPAASSTSSGGTAPLPTGTHIATIGNTYGHQHYPPPQAPSSTTSLPGVGAPPISKPRSLGQQLGFGAPAGTACSGMGARATGTSYGSYGAPFNSNNKSAPHGSTASGNGGGGGGGGQGHVTGAFVPTSGGPATLERVTPPLVQGTSNLTINGGALVAATAPAPVGGGAVGGCSTATAAGPGATPAPRRDEPRRDVPYSSAGAVLNASITAASTAYRPCGGGGPPLLTAPTGDFVPSQLPPGSGLGQPHTPHGPGPGDSGGGGGALHTGGGGGGLALHLPGTDVGALRAANSSLESQVEALKMQLLESTKLAHGAQSLQEQLQHVQMEAHELQRKHREASLRLQEERSRGEAAERERKQAQDKCLMMEAELHKARATVMASGAARTPPTKQAPGECGSGGGNSGGGAAKRPRYDSTPPGPSSPLVLQQPQHVDQLPPPQPHLHAQQPAYHRNHHRCLDQPLDGREQGQGAHVDEVMCEARSAGTSGVEAAAGRAQLKKQGGINAGTTTTTAAAMSAPPSLLPSAWYGLLAARLPLWHRIWCACPDALTLLIHPSASTTTAAAAAVAAAVAPDGQGDGHGFTAAAAADLKPLHFQGLYESQAALHGNGGGGGGDEGRYESNGKLRRGSSDGEGNEGGGYIPEDYLGRMRSAALAEAVRQPLRALAAGRGDGTEVLLGVVELLRAATGSQGGELSKGGLAERHNDATASHPSAREGAAHTSPAPPTSPARGGGDEPHGLNRWLQQQQVALWSLVGPCVDLLGGLLAHSEACRESVGAGTARVKSRGRAAAGAAVGAVGPCTLTGARCGGGGVEELRRGGLPYLLPSLKGPPGSSGSGTDPIISSGTAAAAAAARAERRRQLRSYVYGNDDNTSNGCPADGSVCSLEEMVRLLMAVAASYQEDEEAGRAFPDGASARGVLQAAPPTDVPRVVVGALSALACALPAVSERRALLQVLMAPLSLLVPLLTRPTSPPRLAATSLMHVLLENTHCAAAATAALSAAANVSSSPPHHPLEPPGAVQLFTALLDALEPDEGEVGGSDGDGHTGGGGGEGLPYELPRRVMALLAMLLDSSREALVAALCCSSWLEGYGLPLRLLALADAACSPPGCDDPMQPVYPTPTNPGLDIVSGVCVPPEEWLQRLRVAQEALVLLKELLTCGSEDTRRAALQDMAPSSLDLESQQLVELATSRLGAWPRTPEELLQSAVGPEVGLAPPELAPWAARLSLLGGGGAASRTSVARDMGGGGRGGSGCGGVVVVCNVQVVGALAGSVRRRWQHWQLQQQQAWQQYQLQQQQQQQQQ